MNKNTDITIRPYRSSDYEGVSTILVDSFAGKFENLRNLNPDSLKSLLKDVGFVSNEANEGYLVATANNDVLGVLSLTCDNHKKKKTKRNKSLFQLVKTYGFTNIIRLYARMMILNNPPAKNACYIDHIAVSAHARGLGIGKALMVQASKIAETDPSINRLTLHVAKNNPALNLYEREGFVIVKTFSSRLMKRMFNERDWLYMASYTSDSARNTYQPKSTWYLGFLGFLVLINIDAIIGVLTKSEPLWQLLNLLWCLWFFYFIPDKT
jgi:ribosomal protein S18 acetylase RimI-like enzyme